MDAMSLAQRRPAANMLPSALRAQNLGQTERLASGALGAVLALWGVRRSGVAANLALLAGTALAGRGIAGYCPVTEALGPTPVERRIAREEGWSSAAAATAAVTIARDAEEIYRFVHDPANIPKYMSYVERVEPREDKVWHWVARVPGTGATVEWDGRITEDRPGELVAWEAPPGAPFRASSRTEFRPAPAGRGTEVRMRLAFEPPVGALGRAVAKLAGAGTERKAASDLHRLKQLLETGEIPTPALRRADAAATLSS